MAVKDSDSGRTRDPIVPATVDLKDFYYMPLDISRLFGSEFHAVSSDAEWRAGMTLWLKAYHQVPAASIPDDDVALARLAEFGRDVKAWQKIRTAALRGWVKCSDGRLYHPVVAEKVLEAWIEKLTQRKSSQAGNAKRYGQEYDPAPIEAEIEAARTFLAELNPQSRTLAKRPQKVKLGTPHVLQPGLPVGADDAPAGAPDDTPVGTTGGSPENLPSGSQEKRREEKGRERKKEAALSAGARVDLVLIEGRLREAAALQNDPAPALFDLAPMLGLLDAGYDLEAEILPVIRARRRPGVRSWAWFVQPVHDSRVARLDAAKPRPPPHRGQPSTLDADPIRNPFIAAGAKYFQDDP